jgi:hypothetical protein
MRCLHMLFAGCLGFNPIKLFVEIDVAFFESTWPSSQKFQTGILDWGTCVGFQMLL